MHFFAILRRQKTSNLSSHITEDVNTRHFTNFVAKDRTSLYFLEQIFATCNNLNCCKTGVIYSLFQALRWWGRHESERSGVGGEEQGRKRESVSNNFFHDPPPPLPPTFGAFEIIGFGCQAFEMSMSG